MKMDFYHTIISLYSSNKMDVETAINTAVHSEHNMDVGNEAIHTGLYCLNQNKITLGFLYDLKSQTLYFQPCSRTDYPLGFSFYNHYGPISITQQTRPKMHLIPNNQNANGYLLYQEFDVLGNILTKKEIITYPAQNYQYFAFKTFEGFHYIEIKMPLMVRVKQLFNGFRVM